MTVWSNGRLVERVYTAEIYSDSLIFVKKKKKRERRSKKEKRKKNKKGEKETRGEEKIFIHVGKNMYAEDYEVLR